LIEDNIPEKAIPFLTNNSTFQGEMINQIGLFNIYSFVIGKTECKVKKRTEKNPALKIGYKVTINFKQDYHKGKPNFKVT